MTQPVVRACSSPDLPAVQAIYAHHVLNGTGTFEIDPPSLTEITARHAAITEAGLPWLVAEIDGAVAGYAYAGPFRTRAAYARTLEDSIYVAANAAGRGIGRALLLRLLDEAAAWGARELLAVIGDSQNHASIRLHEAAGFRSVGVFTGVGRKFERWLDVVLMQRSLGPEQNR